MDGYKVAEKILKPVRAEILDLKKKRIIPGLAIIVIGDQDSQTFIYVREKKKKAKEIGIRTKVFKLSQGVKFKEVKDLIESLNKNPKISGILVQLPIPKHLDIEKVLNLVNLKKDVDGLAKHSPYISACASGISEILSFYHIDLKNKKVAIVGAGRIVGAPLNKMLKKQNVNVVVYSTKTSNLKSLTRKADVLIGAASTQNFIGQEMVKNGAVIIDAAKNFKEDVKDKASFLTPKVGGVGPVTVASLLKNVAKAASKGS
ncbi:MAG: bifunctional 5,10-methylenetetrahydrofolate dehydrogenase/5,10-methenyltetrahydrofolate cyclohydrolase [Candidatus Berkelbacteria bacterium]|nr:bifunctional 5,10-methylenetetrahydrofolate dehydrogenase/5,10-methenyltetrahydrofolate cyclohydrolase [Candidatus Berkelbacteria bacterium]